MIVRPGDGVLHLITQPDHAALAGRIMAVCEALAEHPRRAAILVAIAEHDNGWREIDATPAVDPQSGRVLDFVHIAVAARQSAWPRSVGRLSHEPWAAALVAHHALTVYDRFRKDHEWHGFFPEMTSLRDEWLERSGLTRNTLEQDYPWLRLGDVISLAFCTGTQQALQAAHWTVTRSDNRVRVEPAVFAAPVPFSVAAREIPDVRYQSDAALHTTLATAPTRTLAGAVY